MKPRAYDLFCGLGGWSKGFLAEGYEAIGYDIERHEYGDKKYPGELRLQDVLTVHGSEFRDAAAIVASPPCQEFSYMALPWSRAKQIAGALREKVPFPDKYTGSRTLTELTALFDACFRLQREASEAAGRHIPLVVENVKGAQPWVGRAKAHFGSFYLWGDVESVGNRITVGGKFGQTLHAAKGPDGRKVPGMNFHEFENTGKPGRSFQPAAVDSFGWSKDTPLRNNNSKSPARKAASALIAEIPLELAQWIAQCFKPVESRRGPGKVTGTGFLDQLVK